MKPILRILMCCIAVLCGQKSFAQMQFPLISAPELSQETDILLTIDLNETTSQTDYAMEMAAQNDAEMLAVWPLRSIGVICYVFRDPDGDAEALLSRLRSDSRVLTAAPIAEFQTFETLYEDELVPIQDALHSLHVPQAHDVTRGGRATVAVIDSGVAINHPDLIGHSMTYRDFVRLDDSADAERHGTAIAAVIAADAGNGIGMVGIAPEATILPLRACWEDAGTDQGQCNSFTIARALNVAMLEDADIINLSLGGPPDPLLLQLIDEALAQGRIVVAAGSDTVTFPASVQGVIAVSDRPRSDHIVAPGTEILSAAPDGGYDFFTGSSISAGQVSGLAALAVSATGDRMQAAANVQAGQDACQLVGLICD